jgi:hypothetical protein
MYMKESLQAGKREGVGEGGRGGRRCGLVRCAVWFLGFGLENGEPRTCENRGRGRGGTSPTLTPPSPLTPLQWTPVDPSGPQPSVAPAPGAVFIFSTRPI